MALREEMVENGVKFLQHPNVQTTPLSERVSFLEGKGMTKEEIQEAIERHQNGGAAAAPAPAVMSAPMMQQPMAAVPMMPAAPMQQMAEYHARYPAYVRVIWMVSTVVGAASILTFLWNYAVQSGYIPWLRSTPKLLEAAKVEEEKQKEAQREEDLRSELTQVSASIQQQTTELAKLSASLDDKEREQQSQALLSSQISSSLAEQGNAQSIAELKAEISTLKALLVTKTEPSERRDSGEANASAAKALESKHAPVDEKKASARAEQPAPVPVVVAKAERMEKALKKMRKENSLEQLKLAAGILSMYVKNLVENPDVPRYRRIAPGNANFKQKIEPLQHHEELLKSIGFETTGLNMEWKWHTASRTTGAFEENLAILRALLKALGSLTRSPSASNLSLEEIAHASIEEFYLEREKQKQKQAKTESETSSSSTTTTMTTTRSFATEEKSLSSSSLVQGLNPVTGPLSTDFGAFMARLEQQTSSSGSANGEAKKALSASSSSTNVAAHAEEEEEKAPAAMTTPIEPTVTPGGPAYPKSFGDVMELIQKGEPVPGIRDIEDKLSVDSTALLGPQQAASDSAAAAKDSSDASAVSAPAKPWEKLKA